MKKYIEEAITAAKFWDRNRWDTLPIDYWASNPIVQAYINRRTTGNPHLRWLDWVAKKYVPKTLKNGLCLACGAGTAEIHAIGINMCEQMEACDISNASLQAAKEKANRFGVGSRINYFRCDLNAEFLPVERYDIVLSSGGLHHIENIDHLLTQIRTSLKPKGVLAVDEYVGPSRLQYTEQQLEIVNRVLEALPAELRTGRAPIRPDVAFMLENDPSEAVRSAELVDLLAREFKIVEKRFYGGTILNVLYGTGVINTRLLLPSSGGGRSRTLPYSNLLPLILLLEETLTESGILPNDYVVIVAEKV